MRALFYLAHRLGGGRDRKRVNKIAKKRWRFYSLNIINFGNANVNRLSEKRVKKF